MFRSATARFCLATVLTTAGIVLGSAALAQAQTATVTWNRNPETNIAGYIVQYGTTSGSPSSSVDVGNSTSRQFTSLTAGRTYYFRVVAYNTAGAQSQPSTQVSHAVPSTPAPATLSLTSVSPTTGPAAGGTQLTLRGTAFQSGATVTVGGRAATTVFVSSTEVRATTPSGSGTVAVQIRNPNGQTASRASAFTYAAASTTRPNIDSLSPISGPLGGGTVVTLRGSGFVSGATMSVGGRAATTTFVSSTQLRFTTPAGSVPGATSVLVRNPNGLTASRGNAFTYTGSTGGGGGSTSTLRPNIDRLTPISGPLAGGTQIRVYGRSFVNGARITIDARNATTTFVSSTELRATTPAGSSPGGKTLVVRNPNGLTASRGNAFYYLSGTNNLTQDTTQMTALSVDDAAVAADAEALAAEESTAAMPEIPLAPEPEATAGDVEEDGAPNADEAEAGTDPRGVVRRYFLDDQVSPARQTRLALANAGDEAASVVLSFIDAQGKTARLPVDLAARARRTIDLATVPGISTAPFVTVLESPSEVAIERLRSDAAADGAAAISAAVEASPRWYFAGGTTVVPFDLSYVVYNPGSTAARVQVRYLRPDGAAPIVRTYAVAPGQRTLLDVRREDRSLASTGVSTEVASLDGQGIVVERREALIVKDRRAPVVAETSAGATETAASWHLDGATGPYSLFLHLANPGDAATTVNVTYVGAEGARVERTHELAASGRLTVDVASEDPALARTALAIHVESADGAPIFVERSTWWGQGRNWKDGLTGPAAAPAARWVLAEGEQRDGATATSLAVVNAGTTEAAFTVTLLGEDAAEQTSAELKVAPGARLAVALDRLFENLSNQRFSVVVEAADPGAELVVHRAVFAADGSRAGGSVGVATR